jgi:hypothetical protein
VKGKGITRGVTTNITKLEEVVGYWKKRYTLMLEGS